MKRMGMAILALGLLACGVTAQQAPAKAPAAPPAKAPANASGQAPAGQAPAAKAPAPASAFKTQKEKLSYAIGMEMGKGVKSQGLDVDPALLTQGLNDAISGGKSLMSEDELRQVISSLAAGDPAEANAGAGGRRRGKQGQGRCVPGGKWKEGRRGCPSGRIAVQNSDGGQGKKPAETDTVLCNYKGTFLDGTEFDSSAKAGKPVPFEVKNVIPGFKEVLQLMPVGSKWQVVVPCESGLRGARSGRRNRPECHAHF